MNTPSPPSCDQRHVADLVAGRLDLDQFDGPPGAAAAQQVGDVVGLPEGQRAAAGADAERGS